MSLFGKILAIFNVLAVFGVLYLLTVNYARQRRWQYEVFRQDLMMHGLPLDDEEKDELLQKAKDKISDRTKQEVFNLAKPTTAVATQKEEIQRVRTQLSGQIDGAGDKKKQLVLLARVLAPMSLSFEEYQDSLAYQTHLRDDKTLAALTKRLSTADSKGQEAAKKVPNDFAAAYRKAFDEALAETFSDPPGSLADAFVAGRMVDKASPAAAVLDKALDAQLIQLKGQFEKMFADAVSGGEAIHNAAPTPRKRGIARLLLNMVNVLPDAPGGAQAAPDLEKDPAYKRFVLVVGVKSALDAVNDQAERFKDIAFGAEETALSERDKFAGEHRKAVDLVRAAKTVAERHASELALEKQETQAHLATLVKRRRDVREYREKLAKLRRQTAEQRNELRKLSNELLKQRVELRANTEDNQKLEKDIRALEKGR